MAMQITLNGELRELPEHSNLAQALSAFGFEASEVAVAIDTAFVPRSQYGSRVLKAGEQVEVLAPVQGG